jgi:hypothetical protein
VVVRAPAIPLVVFEDRRRPFVQRVRKNDNAAGEACFSQALGRVVSVGHM